MKRKTPEMRTMRIRIAAIILIEIFAFEIFRPTIMALSGPGQPETASFTPASADNMVNLFSGDFSYNIPLLEVDGYPLNLGYKAGITPGQEASWVGLGWNLNPGAITRDVRGIPDDFKGDPITYKKNIKKNVTVGVSGGVSGEITGVPLGLSLSAGLMFNNYRGFDLTTNAGLTLGAGATAKGPFSAALSINNSSMNGITVSPSLSLSGALAQIDAVNKTLGASLNVSSSYNSRAGIQQVGFGTNMQIQQTGYPRSSVGTSSFSSIGLGYSLPRVNTDFDNFSFTGRFSFGVEIFLSDANGFVNGFYSQQKLRHNTRIRYAFGFLNSSFATDHRTDIMDYARENENGFSYEMPVLPLAKMTPDILSVSGQGVSGSYKPYANAFGVIKEASGNSKSTGGSVGVEFAAANIFKAGVNGQKNKIESYSGPWEDGNTGMANIGFLKPSQNTLYENVYYQEANEKGQFVHSGFYNSTGGDKAVRFGLIKNAAYDHSTTTNLKDINGNSYSVNNSFGSSRVKKNKPISLLTAGEVIGGGGITKTAEESYWSQHSINNPHHIGEISVTGEDGKRHVFGLPVYNTLKREVTFAVGTKLNGSAHNGTRNCLAGTITYDHGVDNTIDNEWGLDNYFSAEYTPAYAHSYLPTCILGMNYIDADDIQGPSSDDFGEWVKFEYSKSEQSYKWRIPFEEETASYNPRLETDKTDDMASYVYGEKELVYVDQIETRNYIVKFHTSNREDGFGVKGEQGGIDLGGTVMQKLDSIMMYTRLEYEENGASAVPVKSVHFVYEGEGFGYDLCQGTPTNGNGGGKLTLHEVYFKYRDSNRGKYSGYKFDYNQDEVDFNPDYISGSTDRWGYYEEVSDLGTNCNISAYGQLPPSIYPYSEQDETLANQYAQVWNLQSIDLPSGGRIEVDYEADRYEYLQHKRAMIMKTIDQVELIGVVDNNNKASIISGNYDGANMKFGITLDVGAEIEDYVDVGEKIYFRTLVQIGTGNETNRSDYISGYGTVAAIENEGNIGYVKFQNVEIDGVGHQNPIVVAALQYARLNLSHIVYGTTLINTDAGLTLQLLEAVINSLANLGNMFTSPNIQILDNGRCRSMFLGKSWLRLHNPDDVKFGGGYRVKEIRMFDEWNSITNHPQENTVAQVKRYIYETKEGRTSGVASNEPALGGEESALLKPYFLEDEKNLLAPDNKFYVEEPFGKAFFPMPSIGYSRVLVEDFQLKNSTYKSTNTGYTVSEFYTAKDYPTIYSQTDLAQIHDKSPELNLAKLFGIEVNDFITFSQGFMVETNDMHGKKKKVSVFAEGQSEPIQYTEYKYKDEGYPWQGAQNTRRLVNDRNTLVSPSGVVKNNRPIGVFYELVADSKEETSNSVISTLQANLDASLVFIIPIVVPTAIPKKSKENTSFKYAAVTKTIQKFGILEKVKTYDEGTISEKSYLAFDAETGKPVVTKTQNNFNDAYFTMSLPAFWSYDGMGPSNVNQGFYAEDVYVSGNGNLSGVSTSSLRDGDEIILKQGYSVKKGWIVKNGFAGTKVIDRNGVYPSGSYNYLKVYRSGFRNLLNQKMMEIITLTNPLQAIGNNNYSRVVSASGIEYGNIWRTICDCFGEENTVSGLDVSNPYRMGARGMWRPMRSYTYLTRRTQTDFNENSNIRRDGIFASFNPLYIRNGGAWTLNPSSWTFDSEVTEYSPEGYELETRDPLGRYTSSLYGYNRTLQVAIASNAAQKEIGYDGFEDVENADCGTDHMRFSSPGNYSTISHTGKKSIKIGNGTPISISRDLQTCEPIYNYSCEIVVEEATIGNQLVLTVGCFTQPLSLEFEVLQGNSSVSINGNVITITNPAGDSTPGLLNLVLTDGANCFFSDIISYEPE